MAFSWPLEATRSHVHTSNETTGFAERQTAMTIANLQQILEARFSTTIEPNGDHLVMDHDKEIVRVHASCPYGRELTDGMRLALIDVVTDDLRNGQQARVN